MRKYIGVAYMYITLTFNEKLHHKGIYHLSTVEKLHYTSPSCTLQSKVQLSMT